MAQAEQARSLFSHSGLFKSSGMRVIDRSPGGCPLLILPVAVFAIALPAFGQNPPPKSMEFFPSIVKVADNWVFIHVPWDELEFPATKSEAHPMKRGEFFRLVSSTVCRPPFVSWNGWCWRFFRS